MDFVRNAVRRIVRAFRRAAVPCLLVFVGTIAACLGIGYLLSSMLENALRAGLVLGAVYALAAFLYINPLFEIDEASLEPSDPAAQGPHFGLNPWDTPLSDSGGINPATGLPMFGGLDSGGNVYGAGSSKMNWPD